MNGLTAFARSLQTFVTLLVSNECSVLCVEICYIALLRHFVHTVTLQVLVYVQPNSISSKKLLVKSCSKLNVL